MWVLVYSKDYGGHKAGGLHLIGHGVFHPTNHKMEILEYHEIPDQDVSHLYQGDPSELVGTLDDLKQYALEERTALIDRDTGKAIDEAVHTFAGLEEQIGILRADLAALHVQLGSEPTEDFVRLNDIATEKILEGQKKKEALDESSGSIESAAE
ncbi:MAG: hypothetical protein JRD89_06020 [Deltaproteobacteria bacterium]|nr:hypothetical protein [Deltaproteobacteria bacterium]